MGNQAAAEPHAVRRSVAFVLNSYVFGGVEEHVAQLCEQLPAIGFRPIVICADVASLGPLYDRLRAIGTPCLRISLPGRIGKWRQAGSMAEMLRKHSVDLLHVQLIYHDGGTFWMEVGRRARLPIVVTHHVAPQEPMGILSRLARAPFLRCVQAFIAVSEANRKAQIRNMGLPPQRVTTIHNGIPIDPSAPERAAAGVRLKTLLGLPPQSRIVGAVGRIEPQKGLHWLIDAAPGVLRLAPDAHFVFIGEGSLVGPLSEQAERGGANGRVRWMGFRTDARDLIAGMDVLAMPSRFEGLPIVLLEAMAAATPVVATSVDGIPEAIRDGVEGFLVDPGDVDQLAERIGRVLNDPALAERIGDTARQRVISEFAVATMACRTASVYRRLLGE